jgi:hypothetical protein
MEFNVLLASAMLKTQKLRLSVSRIPGENSRNFIHRRAELFADETPQKVEPQKLFADLLKRQARAAMAAVSECNPVSMPLALAGLSSVRESIEAAIRFEIVPGSESLRSGAQLAYPATLADLLACIEITKRQHRAPEFLNNRDGELAKINEKIDLLAGMMAAVLGDGYEMPGAFCREESEVRL